VQLTQISPEIGKEQNFVIVLLPRSPAGTAGLSSVTPIAQGCFSMRRLICSVLAVLVLSVLTPGVAWAQVHQHESESGVPMVRSLESIRDLDYDSWQAVAYREGKPGEPVVLRIVGYPGKLRIDHPVGLQILAGRRTWVLDDITLDNPVLAVDGRDAAVEFALDPLLNDLTNNRPLRLVLPGVITELPVPPYVVGEWRSLQDLPLS
jgi:hypothetical protein